MHVHFLRFEDVMAACVLGKEMMLVFKNFIKGVRTFWCFHLSVLFMRLL